MAKIPGQDIEIVPTHGGSSCGFTSTHLAQSRVSVSGCGDSGVRIEVERDEEPVIESTRLTLEEGWELYVMLRGMFYATRKHEREASQNKHNVD